MADNPAMESVSKPTTTIQETQQAFANLINTARSDEPKSEVKETEQDNLVIDNELSVDDISEQDLVDNEETTTENNQELFDITINGKSQKVNLDELKEGYFKGSDYTKKTMELSEQRRSIDTELDTISKDKEAVKKMREDYAQKLQVVEQNLQTDDNIDWFNNLATLLCTSKSPSLDNVAKNVLSSFSSLGTLLTHCGINSHR